MISFHFTLSYEKEPLFSNFNLQTFHVQLGTAHKNNQQSKFLHFI